MSEITIYDHDPATPKVGEFLQEQGRGAAAFGVYHVQRGKLGNVLRTVPGLIDGEDLPPWAQKTAVQIVRQAYEDAQEMGGLKQAYAVVAESANGKPIGRVVFRVENHDAEASDDEIDERSFAAMSARHADGLVRLVANSAHRQHESYLKTIDRLESENKRLHETIAADRANEYDRRIQLFKALEEVQSLAVEREAQKKIGEVRAKILERSGDSFTKLIPFALNHWIGKDVLPTDDSPMRMLAKQIADSVTNEEQFVALSGVLGQAGTAALMTFLKKAGAFEDVKPNANGQKKDPPAGGKADA